jgi:hypothetical protein
MAALGLWILIAPFTAFRAMDWLDLYASGRREARPLIMAVAVFVIYVLVGSWVFTILGLIGTLLLWLYTGVAP